MIGSGFFSGLSQYGTSGTVTLGGADLITSTSPPPNPNGPGFIVGNGNEVPMLQQNIASGKLPPITSNTLYFVIAQPNTQDASPGTLGAHAEDPKTGLDVAQTENPATTESPQALALVEDVIRHEVAEAVTDPLGTGILVQGPEPLGGDNEICDFNLRDFQVQLNGATVQPYFSLQNHASLIAAGSGPTWNVSTPDDSNFTVTLNGDQFANLNDSITIGSGPDSSPVVTFDGQTLGFDQSGFGGGIVSSVVVNPGAGTNTITVNNTVPGLSVNINTTGGTDTINVLGIASGSTVNITGNGTNTVTVGNNHLTANIAGTLNMNTTGAATSLTIDDGSDSAAGKTVTLTSGSVTGLSANAINYTGAGLSSLTLETGGSTASGATPWTVNINSTSTKTLFDGGTQSRVNTKVNIGGGNLQNVPDTVLLENTDGFNTITVDDSQDSNPSSLTLQSFTPPNDTLFGEIIRGGKGAIEYEQQDTSSLTLKTGKTTASAPAQVSLIDTPNSTTLIGNGATAITVTGQSNGLAGVAGSLAVQNTAGALTGLTVDDSSDNGSETATLSAGQIAGLTTQPITCSGLNALTLVMPFGSSGATIHNSVNINSTTSGVATNVQVGGGGNNVTNAVTAGGSLLDTSGIVSPVSVSGFGGTNNLFANDLNGTAGNRNVTVSGTSIGAAPGDVFFGPGGSVSYTGMSHVNLIMPNLASTFNQVNVTGTSSGVPLNITLHGTSTTTNAVTLQNSSGTVKSILSPVIIVGANGVDTVTANDSGDTSPVGGDVAVSITQSTVGAGSADNFFGAGGSLSYQGLAFLNVDAPNQGFNNILFVESTDLGTTTHVQAGNSSANRVFVGNVGSASDPVSNIVSKLSITGQQSNPASTSLFVDDSANTSSADTVTVTPTSIGAGSGDRFFGSGGSLSYSGIANVNVTAGTSGLGNSITVQPQQGMLFTINGGKQGLFSNVNKLDVLPINGQQLHFNVLKNSSGQVVPNAGTYNLPPSTTTLVSFSNIQQPSPIGLLVTAPGPGAPPVILVYDAQSGQLKFTIQAFDSSFTGGVRVAVGDVNHDGIPDIIAAQGPGGNGLIHVYSGATGQLLAGPLGSFQPFGPGYHGGINVAAGDVNGDGYANVIVGQDQGGQPEVKVYSGKNGSVLDDFLAYKSTFSGGVTLAAADLNHTGKADIIVGLGPGGPPLVQVFAGNQGGNPHVPLLSFDAFDPTFTGGVFVAAGDIQNTGFPKIIVGEGAGGKPLVHVYDGRSGALQQSFLAFDPFFTGGVRVAVADVTGSGRSDIITGAGPSAQGGPQEGPLVRGFDGRTLRIVDPFFATNPSFEGGEFASGGGRWH
jgi:hypothetical protein